MKSKIIKAAYSAVLAWFSAYITPITPLLIAVFVLVFSDVWTGTRAAKKRGEEIEPKLLRRTITEKIIPYLLAIILSQVMVWAFKIPERIFPITYGVAFFICLTEYKSNIRNITAITGVKLSEYVKGIFKKFQESIFTVKK